MSNAESAFNEFMRYFNDRNPGHDEFFQAVEEVASSIMPWYVDQKELRDARILERLCEPDRLISFRICWENDAGDIQINRGWRVQFNHTLGPYKGGLRFSPAVRESVLKFLGFEQTLKNSLTGLPMGGGKGGSDFNPKGRSEREVMRFCQAFMNELWKHIGPDVDVPAGDIGVGLREISFLFGHYLRLSNNWNGVLTGKGPNFGGSAERTEATGFGAVYFCECMLAHHNDTIEGKSIVISGSGNVALHAAQKAIERGARVLTLSNSDGYALFKDGLTHAQVLHLKHRIESGQGRLVDLVRDLADVEFHLGEKPWAVPCAIAMPCATQNELRKSDATSLIDNGVMAVVEGANMPVTTEATQLFRAREILHGPGKAANAGGVAVSGFEQSQNAMRQSWTFEEVDRRLMEIMKAIHARCVELGSADGRVDYIRGANLAGFQRVARAMRAYGIF